jgi:hypothetical protein
VTRDGPGNWTEKAWQFSNQERSADALRFRWYALRRQLDAGDAPASAAAPAAGGAVPAAWSADEDAQLQQMVAQDGPSDWKGKAARFRTVRQLRLLCQTRLSVEMAWRLAGALGGGDAPALVAASGWRGGCGGRRGAGREQGGDGDVVDGGRGRGAADDGGQGRARRLA